MSKTLSRLIRGFLILIVLVTAAIIRPAPSQAFHPSEDAQPGLSAETSSIFFPLVMLPARPLVKQTLFGVQMYGDTQKTSPYFDSLVDSQASWIRNEISWRGIEPTNREPEDFQWSSADAVVGAVGDGGINMVMTLGGVPDWAASVPQRPNGPINPSHLDDYAEFVKALVERYDGDGYADMPGSPKVTYFQFFNEPDRAATGGPRSGWGDEPAAYAQMLAVAYPAVKAANPDAQVVFAGIAYDWFVDQGGPYVREFLGDVLMAGGGAHFDIMSFHSYPPFASNWAAQGPGLYEKTQAVRTELQGYGLQERPIFITEAGMHSNDDVGYSMTEELQARYVVELFAQSVAADVQTMIWFMLYDPPDWYPFKNGLVTSDETPIQKLAFDAYVVATQMLEDMRPVEILTVEQTGNANMQAYHLRNDAANRTLYVAWMNPIDSTETASLKIMAPTAVVSDIYGAKRTVSDADDGVGDNYVTVQVSAQPTYILIEE